MMCVREWEGGRDADSYEFGVVFGGRREGGIGCLMRILATVASVYWGWWGAHYPVLSACSRAVCFFRSAVGYGLSIFLWFAVAYVQRVHGNGWGVTRRCRRCERICATVGFPLTRRLNPPCRRRRRSLLLRISVEVDFSPSVFPSSSVCSRPPPPIRPSPLHALAPSRASFLLPSPPLRLLASLQVSGRQCIERCARGDLRQADITDDPVSEGHASVGACVRGGESAC